MIISSSAVITYFFIWDDASQRKNEEIQKNIVIAKIIATTIGHEVDERIKKNYKISLNETELDKQQLRQYLFASQEEMYVMDISGKVLAASHEPSLTKTWVLPKDRFFMEALKGKTVVSDLIKSQFTGNYVIVIYTPILKGSKVDSILANELPTTFFNQYLDSIQLGKTERLGLLDSHGYYIYSKGKDSNKNLIFAPCFNYDRDKVISVIERKSFSTGEKTIYTKIRIKNLEWYVVAFHKSSKLAAPAIVILIRKIVIMALLIIVLFILWRYTDSIDYQNRLIKQQNADKLALIGELAAGMAHEIRNPLTTIKGFADLLKVRKSNEARKEILELISCSVRHIEEIVTETLLLAKPQKMNLTEINIGSLIEQVYFSMCSEAIKMDIDLKVVEAKGEIFIKGDVTHIKQLLVNLIKNSLEATPAKGTVIISIEELKKTTKILIKDTGVGMNEDVLTKIGTPFFTTKPDGTGLGLSVCLRIANEHGGSLHFESKPGLGTTAVLELPSSVREVG